MANNSPAGFITCSVLILVASFMPWGTLQASFGFLGWQTITVSGWNGHFTLEGIESPNWMAVLCGLALGVFAVLRNHLIWRAPTALCVILCLYGILHLGFTVGILSTNDNGQLGIGSVLTLGAFLALFVLTIKSAVRGQLVSDNDVTSSV